MTKLQLAVIGSAILLFLGLYFGFETTPKNIRALEKSRALTTESTDLNVLLKDAKATLSADALQGLTILEQQLDESSGNEDRVALLKQLSGEWFALGHPAIAGVYAEQIADLEGTEESWSIAGTTFTLCVQRNTEEKVRNYCTSQAVKAFENAISLNPENVVHQVNLALLYTYHAPPDNPMKGVLMLQDLNRTNPDNVLILTTMGRLAIRTGQYERATERLEQAWQVDPANSVVACLLAQAYEGAGNVERQRFFEEQCQTLSEKTDKENN